MRAETLARISVAAHCLAAPADSAWFCCVQSISSGGEITAKRQLIANEGPLKMQSGYRTLGRAAAFAVVILFTTISRGESRPKLLPI